jgi:hypothetical protein
MKRFLALAAALALTACVTTSSSGRLAGERSLSNTPHGYAIVSDVVRAGSQSQRFEVRPGDCGTDRWSDWNDCENDRERSEIGLDRRWTYGSDTWIGFSVFLPPDFQTSSRVRTTVGQIHQQGGPSGSANGLPSFPPLMQLEMLGDRYFLRTHILSGDRNSVVNNVRDFGLVSINEMRGRWTDIAINFNTSDGEEVLTVFVNGQRRAQLKNWINFIPERYFFKYGIYRSFVSRNGAPMPTQVLYIDEVRMGSSLEEVSVNVNSPVD